MKNSRIIIVGCGPAGIACAIQLKRMGQEPLVIEKDHPGGMLVNANLIENYPGFPGGITGPELAKRLVKQFDSYHIEIMTDEVQSAKFESNTFTLKGNSAIYSCEVLIVATGTIPVVPDNLPVALIENGLVHFDISGLRHFKEKTIGIIGAGDAAFDYSLTLVGNDNNVLIFNRGNRVKALKVLSEKVFINKRITYIEKIELKDLEISADNRLFAIFNRANSMRNYSLDYLIFATGRKPANGFICESLEGKLPELIKNHRLYLIGDIQNGHYRQVSVAVGDGVRAAMEVFRNESNQ